MCGRYRRKSDKQQIAEAFHANGPSIDSLMIAPNGDIRPTTFQPIIRADDEGARLLELARWGFVPFWQKGISFRRRPSTRARKA
jgi:putative SOS response-associated peptidase YedK